MLNSEKDWTQMFISKNSKGMKVGKGKTWLKGLDLEYDFNNFIQTNSWYKKFVSQKSYFPSNFYQKKIDWPMK